MIYGKFRKINSSKNMRWTISIYLKLFFTTCNPWHQFRYHYLYQDNQDNDFDELC